MNVSKTLASTVAALAVVGSVGFAYAQSTSDPAQANPTTTQSVDQNATTTPSSSMDNSSSAPLSTDSSAPMSDSSTSSDLAPQADRG